MLRDGGKYRVVASLTFLLLVMNVNMAELSP